MHRGPSPGAIYDFSADVVNIGRGVKNDIILHDNDVSREHCRLVRAGGSGEYEIHDLASNNGTFVEGQPVKSTWLLHSGQVIQLGDTIVFEYARIGAGTHSANGANGDTHPSLKDTDEAEAVSPGDKPTPAALSPSGHPYLLMTMGPEIGKTYSLSEPIMTIGRHLSNDIAIQDPEVSRHHLRLRRVNDEHGEFALEDLQTTNGTWINEVELSGTKRLRSNDVIRMGSTVHLQYTWQPYQIRPEFLSAPPFDADPLITDFDTRSVDATKLNNLLSVAKRESTLGTGVAKGGLENHIFIAYARDEWETVVAPLTAQLQDAGMDVWVDQYLMRGENDWMQAIEQALSECRVMVVIVSPHALESRYVRLEYRYFYNREKPIIPLLYRPVAALPPELRRRNGVQYDDSDYKRSFQRLIFEVLYARR